LALPSELEDLLAVAIVTGEMITWKVVGLVVLIAIPFAVLGELVVDRVDFVTIWHRCFHPHHRRRK
jgi:hypothetical protein